MGIAPGSRTQRKGKDLTSQRKTSAHGLHPSLATPAPKGYEGRKYKIAVIMGSYMFRHLNSIYQEFDGDMGQAIVLEEMSLRKQVS